MAILAQALAYETNSTSQFCFGFHMDFPDHMDALHALASRLGYALRKAKPALTAPEQIRLLSPISDVLDDIKIATTSSVDCARPPVKKVISLLVALATRPDACPRVDRVEPLSTEHFCIASELVDSAASSDSDDVQDDPPRFVYLPVSVHTDHMYDQVYAQLSDVKDNIYNILASFCRLSCTTVVSADSLALSTPGSCLGSRLVSDDGADDLYLAYLTDFKEQWVKHRANLLRILFYGCNPGFAHEPDVDGNIKYFFERFYATKLDFLEGISAAQWRECLYMTHEYAFCFDTLYHREYEDFCGQCWDSDGLEDRSPASDG